MFSRVGIGVGVLLVSGSLYAQENTPAKESTGTVEQAKPEEKAISIEAEREVLVEHRDSKDTLWTQVCASPCSFNPVGGEYRVIGVNVAPSAPFSINGKGALDVSIGDPRLMRRGLWVGGAGAAAVTLGLVLIISSVGFAELNNGAGTNGYLKDEKLGLIGTGTFISITGLAALIYGGALYLQNRSSHVSGPVVDLTARKAGFTSPLSFTF